MRGDPQSPDGTAHYQPESALLHKVNGQWTVVDQPCEEDGCDDRSELTRIQRQYPAAPKAIFEGWLQP